MHKRKALPLLILTLLLSACGTPSFNEIQDGPPTGRINVANIPNAKPRPLPKSRYGNPRSYVVNGKRYYVLPTAKGYNKRGIASWYGTKFHGRLTSTREPYNMLGMTAASPVLPIPCFARVTNLENGRSIIVKVNDRGPFAPNRIIDLSYAGATKLGYIGSGTAMVQVTTIDTSPKPLLAQREPTPVAAIPNHPELYLQLGAFRSRLNADGLRERVQHYTKRTVHVTEGHVSDHPIYRVQVGPLIGVGESDQLKERFEADGLGDAITIIS